MALCLKCRKPTNRKVKNKPLCKGCDEKHKENKVATREMGNLQSRLLKIAVCGSPIKEIIAKIILKIFYIK